MGLETDNMPCDLQCGDARLNQPNPLTSGLTNDLLSSDGHECDGRETPSGR